MTPRPSGCTSTTTELGVDQRRRRCAVSLSDPTRRAPSAGSGCGRRPGLALAQTASAATRSGTPLLVSPSPAPISILGNIMRLFPSRPALRPFLPLAIGSFAVLHPTPFPLIASRSPPLSHSPFGIAHLSDISSSLHHPAAAAALCSPILPLSLEPRAGPAAPLSVSSSRLVRGCFVASRFC
jgi:hypothetical protein